MARDPRSWWRKTFICSFKPRGCQPILRRDDGGFWDGCSRCNWHSKVTRFDSGVKISDFPLYDLPKAPAEWPSRFHFECAVCGFDDEESRRYAGPLDFYCPLCKVDSGKANLLRRWPVVAGQERAASLKAFEGSMLDHFLNAKPASPMSAEELRSMPRLPVNQGGTHGPDDRASSSDAAGAGAHGAPAAGPARVSDPVLRDGQADEPPAL